MGLRSPRRAPLGEVVEWHNTFTHTRNAHDGRASTDALGLGWSRAMTLPDEPAVKTERMEMAGALLMHALEGGGRQSFTLVIVGTVGRTRGDFPRTPARPEPDCDNFQKYSDSAILGGFMAKGKSKRSSVDRAAEAVGHALGSVAGTIESLQAQHLHPVDEAREALAAGQETLFAAISKAGAGADAMIKKAKAVTSRSKKVMTRARQKSTPAIARVTRYGTEGGETSEESRQPRPEDRETGRGAPEALAGSRSHSAKIGTRGCLEEKWVVPNHSGRRLVE